jgi:hypothetical protein
VSGKLHAPAAIIPEKETAVPIVEEEGWEGPRSGMGVMGEMKKLSYWESNSDSSVVHPVA